MVETGIKTLVLTSMFGALAVLLSFIYLPFPPFGDVTPASTPISIASIIAPSSVGVVASLIKGLGISVWTGKWFMEIPVGVGDAIMAYFTNYLVKKKIKPTYALIAGQLSRYFFTSGMVSVYISIVTSSGIPSPLGGDVITKFDKYAGILGIKPASHPFLLCMAIIWLARFPAMTLSILVNALLSMLVISSSENQLRRFIQIFYSHTR